MNKMDDKVIEAGEEEINAVVEQELTDEQLLQMAEGSCSWGANCNNNGGGC